jgi:NAD(P)-dependent dehydrogenase (short-subunit alcohol dehydrogenase family)
VKKLFARVKRDEGRLDILVNNAWGGYEGRWMLPSYFWEAPLEKHWDGMFVAGLRAHLLATHSAIPLMLPERRGLIVSTVAWDHDKYIGSTYDICKHAIVRMTYGLALELRKHRIATIALAPGFTRTERVLDAFKVDEESWQNIPGLKQTESIEYSGRAVACLAADPNVMRKSGKAFRAGELAREYRFTDIDGRRVPPFTVRSFEKILEAIEKKKLNP